jgi:hypothetical protein
MSAVSAAFTHRKSSAPSKAYPVALLLIAGAALALRALTLSDSLWLDELHTSWVVSGSLSQVAGRAAAGNQGPLYYWAVWLVTRIFAASEISLRSASWLASGVFVVFLGWLTRHWTASVSLGLLASVLAAVDPNCVYYGREARPYAWVALLALCHVAAFRRRLGVVSRVDAPHCRRHWHAKEPFAAGFGRALWRQSPDRGPGGERMAATSKCPTFPARAMWIGLGWALFYTHYTSILLLPAELVYAISSPHRRRILRQGEIGRWLVDLLWIVLGCSLAVPHLWRIAERRHNWTFVVKQSWTSLWTIFPCDIYVAGPVVLGIALAMWDWRRGGRVSQRRLRYFLPLLMCWYLVPVATAWLLTETSAAPILFRRYVWVSVVPLLMHPSLWGTLRGSRRGHRVFAWGMLLLTGVYWSFLPRTTWTIHSHEDWRSAAAVIVNDSSTQAWPVFLRAGLIEDRGLHDSSSTEFREYCSFALRGLYSVTGRSGRLVALPSDRARNLTKTVQKSLLEAQGAWYVHRGSAAHAQQVVDQWQRELAASKVRLEMLKTLRFDGVTVKALRVTR